MSLEMNFFILILLIGVSSIFSMAEIALAASKKNKTKDFS